MSKDKIKQWAGVAGKWAGYALLAAAVALLGVLCAALYVAVALVCFVWGIFTRFFFVPLLGAGLVCWPVQLAWNNSIPFLPDLSLLNAFSLVFLILLLRQPRADLQNHGKDSSSPSTGDSGSPVPFAVPNFPGLRQRPNAPSKAKRP